MIRVETRMKQWFFDTERVKSRIDEANRKALSKAGAFVRRSAQSSIRSSPNPSAPGHPPHSHTGLLKNFIFFAYDPQTRSVVVGPEALSAKNRDAPHLLEYGGEVRPHRNPRSSIRRIGDGGEVRTEPENLTYVRAAGRRVRRGKIRYTTLRTAAQVDRANKLNAQLYGPQMISGRIEPRPYMGPALERESADLPQLWANSIVV